MIVHSKEPLLRKLLSLEGIILFSFFIIFVGGSMAWMVYTISQLGGEDLTKFVKLPEEWQEFEKTVLRRYVKIPEQAVVRKARYGQRGLVWILDVEFELPANKTPPQWLMSIAEKSGQPDAPFYYYERSKRIALRERSQSKLDEIKADKWEIRVSGGILTYDFYSHRGYRYLWTNDIMKAASRI
jgi:hypothetical protein